MPPPASTTFLRDVSQLGGYIGVAVVALIVAVVEWRRTALPGGVGFLVLAVGGQFVVADLVKAIVQRPRPDIHPLTGFSGTSFPSGHATAAAATYMACAFLLSRRRSLNTKAMLVGLAAGIAASVAATRVLLGVHWFTDVLAGLAVGWAWFAVCSIAFGGSLMRSVPRWCRPRQWRRRPRPPWRARGPSRVELGAAGRSLARNGAICPT